jgi:NAD-dependent SIR2 family protein deacetylase
MKTEIKQAQAMIHNSDAILISASNGLSIAEGYNIFADDENFEKYFEHFRVLYGINSLLQGVMAQLPTPDHQEFMRQVHKYLVSDYQPTAVFQNLKHLLRGKNYFVVTSNADSHFQLNGFDKDKLWEIEGNFDGLQMRTPQWRAQENNFLEFVQTNKDKKVLQLELGIGARNQMIKAPLMESVAKYDWQFLTLNLAKEINIAPNIQANSLALPGDIKTTLTELLEDF